MRPYISSDRPGWIYKLDHRKIIIAVFLLRFICATAYDSFVSLKGKDILLPDSKYYSMRGAYVTLLLNGFDKDDFEKKLLEKDKDAYVILQDVKKAEGNKLPQPLTDFGLYSYMVGIIYFLFGYTPFLIRVFNIALSITCVYLLFIVARRQFGILTANLFLLIALFLPTQFVYSITLSRDFLRVFTGCLVIWIIYGGVLCLKAKKA